MSGARKVGFQPTCRTRRLQAAGRFQWKEEEHADPVRQVKAWKELIEMRILSRGDVMMMCGKDPERQMLKIEAKDASLRTLR